MLILTPIDFYNLIRPQEMDQLNLNMLAIAEIDVLGFMTTTYEPEPNSVVVYADTENSILTTHENFVKSEVDPNNEGKSFFFFTIYPPYQPIYDTLMKFFIGDQIYDVDVVLPEMIATLETTVAEPHGDRALQAGNYIVGLFDTLPRPITSTEE